MLNNGDDNRRSYLVAIASSCQMYSGTGKAIFDWIRFAKSYFLFSIMMDVASVENFQIAEIFCRAQGIDLFPVLSAPMIGCPDTGFKSAGAILARGFDFVECISWASSACNLAVLAAIPPSSKLLFTPHAQPLETLPNAERFFNVEPAFRATVESADMLLLDSRAEVDLPLMRGLKPRQVTVTSLGVDERRFFFDSKAVPGSTIITVADFNETRKRIGLVLEAFGQVTAKSRDLTLTLVGKGSQDITVPPAIDTRVSRKGYIPLADLRVLYQTSALFVLFSEYEAFGLPIAEALVCGCPVLLSRSEVLVEVFGSLPGVHFTDGDDGDEAADLIVRLSNQSFDREAISRAAIAAFGFQNTYGRKLEAVRSLC